MQIEVIFDEPRDITSPGLDGVVFKFPFVVRRRGEGAARDQISHHSVVVSISGTLLSMWDFNRFGESDNNLTKTLFEFAHQHIVKKLQQGALETKEKIDLFTNTAPNTNPFDPSKITEPTGAKFQIETKDVQTDYAEISSHETQQNLLEPPVAIQASLRSFKEDYPISIKTAFVMMQFSDTPVNNRIIDTIRETLDSYGMKALRADDKDYHEDLFSNVLTYIYGCSFGIAVFERIETSNFNPNVSFEVGYMLALNKQVCLLKDGTLTALHSDLIGKLYKVFDVHNPNDTIPSVLSKWLQDKNLIQVPEKESSKIQRYKCEYFGTQDRVREFSKEAYEFGAKPLSTLVHEDGIADIEFNYSGVYPRDLFDQLARKYNLKNGHKPQ